MTRQQKNNISIIADMESNALNEMRERNIEPDNVTCNTLINAYCKIRDTRSAVNVKNL